MATPGAAAASGAPQSAAVAFAPAAAPDPMLAALESTFALPSSTNEGAGSSSAASTQRQSGSGPSLEELAAKHAESAKNINMAELAASVASIENPGRKRGTAAKREAKAKAAAGGVGDFRGLGFAPPVPKKKAQPKKPGKRGKRGKHRRDAGSAYADKLSSKVARLNGRKERMQRARELY